jgi:DNA-binding transcriptional LysR family regulator
MNFPLVNLRELHRLLVLLKHRSYMRAAEELGITQSALTRSIQMLEGQFSVRLLDRGRGGVRLTPVGRRFMQEAEALLYQASEFSRKMSAPDDGCYGKVSIGFAPHAAPVYLPQLIPELMADCPNLSVRAEVQNAGALFALLARGDIEFVVCADSQIPEPALFDLTLLKEVPVAVLVRRGHPLAKKRSYTQAELRAYPNISGRRAGSDPDPTISCDDFGVLRAITVATDAMWLGPTLSCLDETAREDLVELKITGGAPNTTCLVLLTAQRRTLSPQAVQVIDRVVRMSDNSKKIINIRKL